MLRTICNAIDGFVIVAEAPNAPEAIRLAEVPWGRRGSAENAA